MSRILVVEDSPTQAREVEIILTAAGHDVRVAGDGDAALAAMRDASFDLVVSDILMPGMSGYELCRLLNADASTADVPVVLLTSLHDPMDIIKGLECGADNFISKPYEPDHLVARIGNILATHAHRRAHAAAADAEVLFLGERFTVGASKEQILDLLVSTFEDSVRTNRQLEQRQAELVRVQRQKEQLAALVVHDLKNPLNTISLAGQLLVREKHLSEDGKDSVRRLQTSLQTMLRMIMNLLDISRSEDGELVPRPSTFDLGELLQEVRASMSHAAEQRRTTIVVEPVRRTKVHADRDLLMRVLANIVDNSIKYSPSGSEIRIDAPKQSDGWTEICVRDNGPGIPLAHREKIFDKYAQLEPGSPWQSTSRGLGLSFCRIAMEAHGGSITVGGNEPRGSTFRMRLPPARANTKA